MTIGKLLRGEPMHRLPALFLYLMLVLSLAFGSVAHATEGPVCIEATTATAIDHVDGDADQVPADADKAYPHHHGGCHGHHVGMPIATDPAKPVSTLRTVPLAWNTNPRTVAPSDPALRPPQA
jgi:hypothetical protein